jgi:hypothetical protein
VRSKTKINRISTVLIPLFLAVIELNLRLNNLSQNYIITLNKRYHLLFPIQYDQQKTSSKNVERIVLTAMMKRDFAETSAKNVM